MCPTRPPGEDRRHQPVGVIARWRRSHELDRAFTGDVCLHEGAAHSLGRAGLLRARLDAPDAATARPVAGSRITYATTCVRFGGDLVILGPAPRAGEPGPEQLRLERLSLETGALRWSLPLGSGQLGAFGGSPDRHDPDAHPLRGDLQRFVAFTILPSGAEALAVEPAVVVVDLEDGRVISQDASDEALASYQVLKSPAGIHYLAGAGHVLAFDGATGRPLAARRGPVGLLRPAHTTATRLWVYAATAAPADALPWLALDARTLAPVASPDRHTLTLEDVGASR